MVVVQLGYGGGGAWGVSPEAAVISSQEGDGAQPSWKAFREEVRVFSFRSIGFAAGTHVEHEMVDTASVLFFCVCV